MQSLEERSIINIYCNHCRVGHQYFNICSGLLWGSRRGWAKITKRGLQNAQNRYQMVRNESKFAQSRSLGSLYAISSHSKPISTNLAILPYRHGIDRSAVGAALTAKTDIMIPRVSIRFLNVTVASPRPGGGVGSDGPMYVCMYMISKFTRC